MVVSSQNNYVTNIIGLGFLVILSSVFFLSINAIVLSCLLLFFSTLLLISYGISLGRTITFSDVGCSIKIWKIEKRIDWRDISIIRLEPSHLGLRNPYHYGGVFFSIRKVHKPRICDPCLYCMFFHPFSCFWVYFLPAGRTPNSGPTPGVYEVNKESFLTQLSAWGIKLQT